MRGPVLIAMAVALGLAGWSARARGDQPTGYDHSIHDGKVAVHGDAAITCATCHPIAAGGALLRRPGHRACFGACHGPTPTRAAPGPDDRLPICRACHAEAALTARVPTVTYPPYTVDADFGLAFGHARHAGADCTTCHATPGGPAPTRPPAPHARCVGCHAAAAAPAMTACAACHAAGFGANLSPRRAKGELALGATFEHVRHRRRQPTAAALACATCHRAIATTDELVLPAPTVATCAGAGCHDGRAAFATTDQCTRCHARPPTEAFVVARPTARYAHQAHAGHGPVPACAGCHRLDGGREVLTARHDACVACHAGDFAARQPVICGACHGATEPWRHLVADRSPAPRSEFGVEIDHRRHADLACTRCHDHDTAAAELRPARGHAACVGSGCHGGVGAPAPQLSACEACHALGRDDARAQARADAPWGVRARFRHAPHRTDGDAALPCVGCHVDVATTDTVAAIAGPPKPTCAGCHDGDRAFRMTGHGCARCHGR